MSLADMLFLVSYKKEMICSILASKKKTNGKYQGLELIINYL